MTEPTRKKRQIIADRFGRHVDPLRRFDADFQCLDIDPFAVYVEDVIDSKNYAEGYVRNITRTIRQWNAFMDSMGRHPVCPSTTHVEQFAVHYRDVEANHPKTVIEKLNTLGRAFRYFQSDPAFPHPADFDPFEAVKHRVELHGDEPKKPRPLQLTDLREVVRGITHVRDRGIIVAQFKLGLRSSELCNIKLSEVHLADSEFRRHYDEMGMHPQVRDRPNSVYIPHDRPGNKSTRPRCLPLDDELRDLLRGYLSCRPDNDEPWVFLSKKGARQLNHKNVNEDIWKKHFRPRYGPTDRYRGISPHSGRHYFTTWWTVKKEIPRPLVKYMRGDKQTGGAPRPRREAIDHYVHAYFADIESIYRRDIFKFERCHCP